MDELNLDDLSLAEIRLSIGGRPYILREASEDAHCKYRDARTRAYKLGPDGKPTAVDGMAATESLLVSLCLFPVVKDKDGAEVAKVPVPVQVVRSWSAKHVRTLFQKAKELSGLEDRETVEGLEAQLTAVQVKLARLRGNGQTEHDPEKERSKNLPSVTANNSA